MKGQSYNLTERNILSQFDILTERNILGHIVNVTERYKLKQIVNLIEKIYYKIYTERYFERKNIRQKDNKSG